MQNFIKGKKYIYASKVQYEAALQNRGLKSVAMSKSVAKQFLDVLNQHFLPKYFCIKYFLKNVDLKILYINMQSQQQITHK